MTIEEIRDLDSEIFEAIMKNFHLAYSTFNKYGFPNVGKALVMFSSKANFIKNSIFDISENEDTYSANILFRSLIDHHLKSMYIFLRHIHEKSDEVGKEYYQYCDYAESIIVGKSFLDSWNILTTENKNKLYEIIIEKNPELRNLPKDLIIKKAKQFNYKNIVSFLKDTIEGEKSQFGWLDKIIPNYGELSSYVHGGPLADKYQIFMQNKNERGKELLNICKLTFQTANALKQFIYVLLYNLDSNKYSKTLTKIDGVFKVFNKSA